MTEQKLAEAAEIASSKSLELIRAEEKGKELAGEVARLEAELAKAKHGNKMSLNSMRQKLDEYVKKHRCEPAEELLKMVMEQQQVVNEDGSPALDRDGNPRMRFTLPPDTRASVLLKLMEFRMPKLRATEGAQAGSQTTTVVVVKFGDQHKPRAMDVEAEVIDG